MDRPLTLSVIIITKNEERNLARCLNSVREFANEILIRDSFSTDRTRQVAFDSGLPVRWFESEFPGYGKAKNDLAQEAVCDLIFSIDADEEVDNNLKISLLKIKAEGAPGMVYAVDRLNNYCGRWIRHGGWNPDIKPRLWLKGKASWSLSEVHEILVSEVVKPQILPGRLLHYSYTTTQEHLQKIETYSTRGALRMKREGKSFSYLSLLLSPAFRFFRDYVLKAGFLDGSAGFRIARLTAFETWLKYKKLKSLLRIS